MALKKRRRNTRPCDSNLLDCQRFQWVIFMYTLALYLQIHGFMVCAFAQVAFLRIFFVAVMNNSWSARTVCTRGGWLWNTAVSLRKLSRSAHEKCWVAVFRVSGGQVSPWVGEGDSSKFFPNSQLHTWHDPNYQFPSSPHFHCAFWIGNRTSTSNEESSHSYALMITDDSFICSIWCSWCTCSVSYRLIGLCENIFVKKLCLVHEEVM